LCEAQGKPRTQELRSLDGGEERPHWPGGVISDVTQRCSESYMVAGEEVGKRVRHSAQGVAKSSKANQLVDSVNHLFIVN